VCSPVKTTFNHCINARHLRSPTADLNFRLLAVDLPKKSHHFANQCIPRSVRGIDRLIDGNKIYAKAAIEVDSELHKKLATGQTPEVLWLGCSDSRVPETTVCDCKPGDIFVHRNIANVITDNDQSAGAVIDFAVGVVHVDHIIVCGHTKCGGTKAALGDDDLGENLNAWLAPLRTLRRKHQAELDAIGCIESRMIHLSELNVLLSIEAVKRNPTVQKAMKERGLSIHGGIYDVPSASLKIVYNEVPLPAAEIEEHNDHIHVLAEAIAVN
jgi:carbonic anhydrase